MDWSLPEWQQKEVKRAEETWLVDRLHDSRGHGVTYCLAF